MYVCIEECEVQNTSKGLHIMHFLDPPLLVYKTPFIHINIIDMPRIAEGKIIIIIILIVIIIIIIIILMIMIIIILIMMMIIIILIINTTLIIIIIIIN